MKLSQFKFRLPDEKIALYPRTYNPETKYYNRDEAKLMVVHKKTGEIEHRLFKEITDYFEEGDAFVFNDTRVFPARLYGNKEEKTGARIEVFLLRELNEDLRLWDVLVDPARKIRIGNKLYFGADESLVAEVIDNTTSRGRTLRFLYDGPHDVFKETLYNLEDNLCLYFTGFSRSAGSILKEQAKKLDEMGYEIKVGTECEFYLFKLDENGQPTNIPHDMAGYCDLAPMDKGENVRREIILNLEQMGITPETSHHESGPGQNEIDFRYDSIIAAADNVSTFKNVVRSIASQSGLFATFAPKPLENQAGSGLHINISLYKNGENLLAGNAPESGYFIAGILKHISEITSFLNPYEQSYRRLGSFEAPNYVSWSKQNRSQLIRIPAASGDNVRFELRSADPGCNPYLALALVCAAGIDGIKNKLPLPKAVDLDLFNAPKEALEKLEKLPSTLDEALNITQKSEFVASVLPKETIDSYIQAKRETKDPEFWEL